MPMTPAGPRTDPDPAWMQRAALLDTTLSSIIRVATQMQGEVRNGELDLAHASRLGRATLVVVEQAAKISERTEITAKGAAA